jgi:hypothetical protein
MFTKNLDDNVFFKFRLQCKINLFKSTLKKEQKNISKKLEQQKFPIEMITIENIFGYKITS